MSSVAKGLLCLAWPAVFLAGLLGVDLVNELLLLVEPVLPCLVFLCWFSRFSRAWRSLMKAASPLPHVHLGTQEGGGGLSHQGHPGC